MDMRFRNELSLFLVAARGVIRVAQTSCVPPLHLPSLQQRSHLLPSPCCHSRNMREPGQRSPLGRLGLKNYTCNNMTTCFIYLQSNSLSALDPHYGQNDSTTIYHINNQHHHKSLLLTTSQPLVCPPTAARQAIATSGATMIRMQPVEL